MFILALKIHCSKECKDILDILDGYHLSDRGYVNMKVLIIHAYIDIHHIKTIHVLSCVDISPMNNGGKTLLLFKKDHK